MEESGYPDGLEIAWFWISRRPEIWLLGCPGFRKSRRRNPRNLLYWSPVRWYCYRCLRRTNLACRIRAVGAREGGNELQAVIKVIEEGLKGRARWINEQKIRWLRSVEKLQLRPSYWLRGSVPRFRGRGNRWWLGSLELLQEDYQTF